MTIVVDALMAPLRPMPPLASLGVLALLTAVGLLLVFRLTLDPRRVEAVKRRIHAAVFEMRLFQDDLRAVLRAARDVVRHNVAYLGVWLVPVLIVTVPMTVLLAQLDAFYGYSGVEPAQSTLLVATLGAEPGSPAPEVELDAPDGVQVGTPALWFPAAAQVVWRIAPRTTGEFDLRLRAGGRTVRKTLQASTGVARRSPRRVEAGLTEELRYPSEPPLGGEAPVRSIEVEYPAAEITVLGWSTHWLVPYLGLLLIFAYALRRPFGVVF